MLGRRGKGVWKIGKFYVVQLLKPGPTKVVNISGFNLIFFFASIIPSNQRNLSRNASLNFTNERQFQHVKILLKSFSEKKNYARYKFVSNGNLHAYFFLTKDFEN